LKFGKLQQDDYRAMAITVKNLDKLMFFVVSQSLYTPN